MTLLNLSQGRRRWMTCWGLVLLSACGGGSEKAAPFPEPTQAVLSASACTPQAVSAGEAQWRGTECLRTVPALRAPNSKRLSASSQPAITAYELMEWAELQYPQYFAPAKQFTYFSEPYFYRYYPGTGNYIGVSGGEVFVLGPLTGGKIARVGALEDFACPVANVGCPPPALAEIPAKPVRIAFIVSDLQLRENGARINEFARALVSDLNWRGALRSGLNAPSYTVQVLRAAGTAKEIRDQLKPFDSAMLIGQVPVPYVINWPDGLPAPLMAPLRLPACDVYEFEADGSRLKQIPAVVDPDPRCRHGTVISVLRAPSDSPEVAAIGRKLEQFAAYHRASDASNAAWDNELSYVNAIWGGEPTRFDRAYLQQLWSENTLNQLANGVLRTSFLTSGAAEERRRAFVQCIGSAAEVCTLYAHGDSDGVLFEGPGELGKFYSDEKVEFRSGEIDALKSRAKLIEVQSCSTHNFMARNSFAAKLLFSGDSMLSMGASTTAWGSSADVLDGGQKVYALVGGGNTFADLVRLSARGDATTFQGNPFISFRPVPALMPRLEINGVHFNDVNLKYPLEFPDSRGSAPNRVMLMLKNSGAVDLHVQIGGGSPYFSVDDRKIPEGGYNGGFSVVDPYPSNGRELANGIGGRIFMIKPNGTLRVTYEMAPWVNVDTGQRLTGKMSASLELLTTDPSSARITIEGRMTVH